MARGDSGPGGELPCILEEIDFRKFGDEDVTCDFANSWDAREEFHLFANSWLFSNECVDPSAQVGDLLLLGFDPPFERSENSWIGDGFALCLESGIVTRE